MFLRPKAHREFAGLCFRKYDTPSHVFWGKIESNLLELICFEVKMEKKERRKEELMCFRNETQMYMVRTD